VLEAELLGLRCGGRLSNAPREGRWRIHKPPVAKIADAFDLSHGRSSVYNFAVDAVIAAAAVMHMESCVRMAAAEPGTRTREPFL